MTERAVLHAYVEHQAPGATVTLQIPREKWLALFTELTVESTEGKRADDRLLTAEEVAKRLRLSIAVVYRRAKRWPFTHRLGRKKLLISETGLNRWLERQR